MFTLKGFATSALVSNQTPGAISPIGELSPLGYTYSTTQGEYSNANFPNVAFNSFYSYDDVQGPINVPALLWQQVLNVSNYIYAQTFSGQPEVTQTDLLNGLLTQYAGNAENFQCGAIVSNGANWVPEWVSWNATASYSPLNASNFIKVWFSDPSFTAEYDSYQITVIPPTDQPLDNFFRSASNVATMLAAMTPVQMMSRTQAAKNGNPETVIRTDTFNYVDPNNSTDLIPTNWNTIIYSNAGNTLDNVKNAIQAYILQNSSHNQNDWDGIFPDIFNDSQFILIPLWDQYAIPNRQLQAGIYSPIVNLTSTITEVFTETNIAFPGVYPQQHITTNATVFSFPYKSLQIACIGSPNNIQGKFQLQNFFSDYIDVSSTSNDFDRQSLPTQQFSLLLYNMILTAESVTEFSSISAGMSRIIKNGKIYITASFNNIDYLVSAKVNQS